MPSVPDRADRRARDTWFVVAAIVVFFLVTLLPDVIGHTHATDDRRYIGPFGLDDELNLYYSFISQARDGAWLFENRLTTVSHPARWLNGERHRRIQRQSSRCGLHGWRARSQSTRRSLRAPRH